MLAYGKKRFRLKARTKSYTSSATLIEYSRGHIASLREAGIVLVGEDPMTSSHMHREKQEQSYLPQNATLIEYSRGHIASLRDTDIVLVGKDPMTSSHLHRESKMAKRWYER
jgi:folate-dependent tRNA-U54 methylase TrmFO/GidA